jgi:hypothetical protein
LKREACARLAAAPMPIAPRARLLRACCAICVWMLLT